MYQGIIVIITFELNWYYWIELTWSLFNKKFSKTNEELDRVIAVLITFELNW